MDHLFVAAFGLGLALSAAPGALNVESVRRGVSGGFWPALEVHVGALLGDGVWMLVALLGVTFSVQHAHLPTLFMALGGAFLLWNAWQIARTQWFRPAVLPLPQHGRHGMLVGALLALGSPLTVAFWAGLNGMLVATAGSAVAASDVLVLCSAYVLSVLAWGAALSALAVWGQRMIRPAIWRWWHAGSVLLLSGWGVQMLWTAGMRLVE